MKKAVGILLILLLLGALGWQIYQRLVPGTSSSGNQGQGPGGRPGSASAVAVEISPVDQRAIQDIGDFTGSLFPTSQFIIAPKIPGRLEKLFVDIGDRVERDQLIAKLEDDVYQQEVEKARAELDVARANLTESQSALAIAKRDYERAQALRKENILSQSGLDTAEAKYNAAVAQQRVAQAQISNRESGLKTAQVRLSYTEIQASWEPDSEMLRVVGERFVDEGSILKTNDPIVSILDLSTITCVIQVIERDYFKVHAGQQAVITTDAYPGRTFIGHVARIAPLLQETSRQARIEIEILNPDELLKPGMFVRVQIAFANLDQATVVPVAALTKRQEQQGVFLADLDTMTVRFVPVSVGVIDQTLAQIIEPALSGNVVTLGQYLLEDGAAILLPEEPQPSSTPRKRGQSQEK